MAKLRTRLTFKEAVRSTSPSIIEEEFGYKRYPFSILHSGSSLLMLNGAGIVTEKKVMTFDKNGGTIVFSVDVNVHAPVDSLIGRIKIWIGQKLESYQNRIFKYKKIQNVIDKFKSPEEGIGFSIGNYFKGKYVDQAGHIYNESSLSVELIGISSELLELIAAGLAQEFDQETVLVKDYAKNEFYLENREAAQ